MLAAEQKHPLSSTDPDELERLAKQKLSEGGWLYASSNAGNSFTHRANREGERLSPAQDIKLNPEVVASLSFLSVRVTANE